MKINNNAPINPDIVIEDPKDRMKLSSEDFLQIMAAELKYQNASGDGGSGSNTDYMSQLSQYTMIDQITALTENLNQINMYNQVSLVGKNVSLIDEEDNFISGTVEKVKFQNTDVMLHINGKDYSLDLLREVSGLDNNSEGVDLHEL